MCQHVGGDPFQYVQIWDTELCERQARLEDSGGPGQIDNMGLLYITMSNIAYVP